MTLKVMVAAIAALSGCYLEHDTPQAPDCDGVVMFGPECSQWDGKGVACAGLLTWADGCKRYDGYMCTCEPEACE